MEKRRVYAGNRVVPFERNGQFFYKLASQRLGQYNYLSALKYLRRALECEPRNVEYMLDLAETFTEMNLFDESNQVLFHIVRLRDQATTECFFGIGCNFMGLQEYDHACESFKTYIRLDPDGEYREEADDILNALEEEKQDEVIGEGMYEVVMEGKEALDRNEYDVAIENFQKALENDPSLHFARNNLALAYFCKKELSEAMEQALMVLQQDPDNLHANCNMAMFLADAGEEKQAWVHASRAMTIDTDDIDEMYKVCLTLCELKRHEEAYARVKELLRLRPYDKKTLHYMATVAYNLGKYKEALEHWDTILRIDPRSAIAPYYMKLARTAEKLGSAEPLDYRFQVPHDEILLRIWHINRIVRESADGIAKRWKEDSELRGLVSWGLELGDSGIKRALLSLLAIVGDEQAEDTLREFLTRRSEPDELKREVFGHLKQMGAPEPYIAFVDHAMVEVRVSVMESHERLPAEYEKVIHAAIKEMIGRYGEGVANELMRIWEAYVRHTGGTLPRINSVAAWVAALEYVYCKRFGIDVKAAPLTRRYGTSNRTLKQNAQRLIDALSALEETKSEDH